MLKVGRAFQQIDALRGEINGFRESEPYRFRTDREGDWHVIRVNEVFREPPPEWGVIVGEIAHDLRSALDGLVWQLAKRDRGIESTTTEFPIYLKGPRSKRATRFPGRRGRVEGINSRHLAMLEAVQPYKRRHGFRRSHLWSLHELNNADKHRLLQVVAAVPLQVGMHVERAFFPRGGRLGGFDQIRRRGPLETNTQIARFRVSGKGVQVQMHPEITLDIEFSEGCDAVKNSPVVQRIYLMAEDVMKIVNIFVPELD